MIDTTKGIFTSGPFLKVFLNGGWCNINEAEYPEAWIEAQEAIKNEGIEVLPESIPLLSKPTQEEKDAQEIREINARFDAISIASIRPLRAIQLGTDTAEDNKKLEVLELEAAGLRERIAVLKGKA